jgi:hypothetical protein
MEEHEPMRPHGFDEIEQLRYAKAHAEMLREEWRLANSSGAGRRSGERHPGAVRRARAGAGRALIEFGRRLLPAETGARRVAAAARRPE